MKRSPQAVTLLVAWLAVLAACGWYVQRSLLIGADLRLFLPAATTPDQHLLLEEIGEGPASRILVVAIGGGEPEALADVSRALVEELGSSEQFRFVSNGEVSLDAVPEELLPYRYLLSRTLDAHTFDAAYLQAQLQTRVRDLASPAGAFLEPWLPRDPTMELLNVLQSWQPMREPNRLYDVWFDRDGQRALLLAETVAPAFDPDRQRAAIAELEAAFSRVRGNTQLQLTASGAGTFSVLMEQRTRGEAQMLGTAATAGMILLVLFAYRRIDSVVLSALPLASAGLAGLFAVSALFGEVHGITLAFGFTLIGVAQDYPMHLLSHQRAGKPAFDTVRELWPTLATGVASTCIAYLTFLFSGVTGLRQLACFTVAGLLTAALTTRVLLPRLINDTGPDYGDSARLGRLWQRIADLPRWRGAVLALAVAAVAAILLVRTPMWENDLGKLTPVPADLLEHDQALRAQLGTPDIRYMLVVASADADQALVRLEMLERQLEKLVQDGAIAGYDHAARYVPSRARQLGRRARLPDDVQLRGALDQALQGSPFRAGVFEPFLADVARARALTPLTPAVLRSSPLGAALDMLLTQRDRQTLAFVTFASVNDPQALQQLARAAGGDTILLDLKLASESLVAQQRTRMLWSLAIAAILLACVVALALRNRTRVVRVLAPMALTTLLVVAVLHGAGVSLTLFHLIALILAAGLGLDYALFFEHAADDAQEQRRTLHAVLVCSCSTLLVFALLALSSLPVLRAIGVTVTLGVVLNFVLALAMTRAGRGVGREDAGLLARETPRATGVAANSGSATGQQPSTQSPVAAAQSPIAALIPHQGAMCLWQRVLDWDADGIRLESDSHRSPDNPLRLQGRLRAIHLCEYGAQAMAVHGALIAPRRGERAAPGMLVALRSVEFHCDYIEDLADMLHVDARCLQASESSQQYSFRITCADRVLAEGRAAVVLRTESQGGVGTTKE